MGVWADRPGAQGDGAGPAGSGAGDGAVHAHRRDRGAGADVGGAVGGALHAAARLGGVGGRPRQAVLLPSGHARVHVRPPARRLLCSPPGGECTDGCFAWTARRPLPWPADPVAHANPGLHCPGRADGAGAGEGAREGHGPRHAPPAAVGRGGRAGAPSLLRRAAPRLLRGHPGTRTARLFLRRMRHAPAVRACLSQLCAHHPMR